MEPIIAIEAMNQSDLEAKGAKRGKTSTGTKRGKRV